LGILQDLRHGYRLYAAECAEFSAGRAGRNHARPDWWRAAEGADSEAYATRPWKVTAYTHDGDRFDLGGRTLEVIATPGHTPDAISLLDRTNGLLFTGDTYYPAPIWLFRPETDLDAYAASIRRLAALTPQVRVVMGAHNIPVASPTVLPRLVAAFDAVRAGKIQPSPDSPGKVLYKVDDISFLMRAPAGINRGRPPPSVLAAAHWASTSPSYSLIAISSDRY